MFEHFTFRYSKEIEWETLALSGHEVETIFSVGQHVVYPRDVGFFVVGYTGSKMLTIHFELDFGENRIIIEEIFFTTPYELDELYCKPRCAERNRY